MQSQAQCLWSGKTIYKVISHHLLQCMGPPGTLQLHEHLLPLFPFILDILLVDVYVLGEGRLPRHAYGDQNTALWSQFSLTWVSGVRLRTPGLQQAPLHIEPSHWPNR